MKIIIGCVDGKTYKSKFVRDNEILTEIQAAGGRVGKGRDADKVIKTAEEFKEWMSDFLMHKKDSNYQTFTIEQKWGRSKTFNVQHVVWWEIF